MILAIVNKVSSEAFFFCRYSCVEPPTPVTIRRIAHANSCRSVRFRRIRTSTDAQPKDLCQTETRARTKDNSNNAWRLLEARLRSMMNIHGIDYWAWYGTHGTWNTVHVLIRWRRVGLLSPSVIQQSRDACMPIGAYQIPIFGVQLVRHVECKTFWSIRLTCDLWRSCDLNVHFLIHVGR